MSRITTEIKYSLIQFTRSPQSIFFAFVLPVLFLILAWYLFGGQSGALTLYYTDGDGSPESAALLEALNATGTLNLVDGQGTNLSQSLKDGKIASYLEIPPGFGDRVAAAASGNGTGAGLTVAYDGSKPSTSSIVSCVGQAVARFNLGRAGSSDLVTLDPQGVATAGADYVDFLVPGVLGIAVFVTAIDLTVGFIASQRSSGLSRKIATTPLTSVEWCTSRVVSGTIVVLTSAAVTLAAAWLAFGVWPGINALSALLVLAGSLMFISMGLVLGLLFRDVQSANMASFTITLPLIFISGSLFPVERLPRFLRDIATLSPLTCLNDGLRSAMIMGNTGDALTCLGIMLGLGVALLVLGVIALRRWSL